MNRLALAVLLAFPLAAGCPPEAVPDAGPDVEPGPEPENPGAIVAELDVQPLSPAANDGDELPWPAAIDLGRIEYVPNRDSATIFLPVVDGVVDYRAFVITDDLALDTSDGEQVQGTAVHCAGYRQHNDAFSGSLELLRRLEIAEITERVRVVVEAIDTACPYTGAFGATGADIEIINEEVPVEDSAPFSVYTEDDIVSRYGSMVFNGHRPAAVVGQPAAPEPPTVLARTTVFLEPNPNGDPAPTALVFDGFDDDTDQPTLVSEVDASPRSQRGKLFQNSDWSFYTYGAEHSQFFVDRGRLHYVIADWAQDIFATNIAYPRRPAQVDDTDYVHATWEVASNATQRRYWWFFLCGAENPGETMDADGKLLGDVIQTSFFYQPDGRNPSEEFWNCLQVFPRDGWPQELGPSDTRPQSDVRVMVNVAGAPERESVVNVSPDQYDCCSLSPGWFRQMDENGDLIAPILDDQLLVAPRTRYDVYVRRDRVVLYVGGEQRLCNDFPGVALTMAEGAVGFGQVLYHSAAERIEFFRDYNDRTGQRYYIENSAFIDERTWDNMGYDELVPMPDDFDENACFVYTGP